MTTAVHLIEASTPLDMLEQVRLLAGPRDEVVSIGPPPEWRGARRLTAVHCPLGIAALAGRQLPPRVRSADLLHAWSPRAAEAALGCRSMRRPVLSLPCAPVGASRRRIVEWGRFGEAVLTVPTEEGRRRLAEEGVPAPLARVLPPAAEPLGDVAAMRKKVRDGLGVRDDQVLLVAPGQMHREAGHKYAPWVHAVLRQMRPDLRLIIPGTGDAEPHVRFYVGTTGLGEEVFFTKGRFAPEEALAAADMAVVFHERDCGVGALAAAMAAGLPIVASRTPEVVECTGDGEAAVLIKPADPREGAAGVLRLLDDQELGRRIARAAIKRAEEVFCPTRCRRELERVYKSFNASSPDASQ